MGSLLDRFILEELKKVFYRKGNLVVKECSKDGYCLAVDGFDFQECYCETYSWYSIGGGDLEKSIYSYLLSPIFRQYLLRENKYVYLNVYIGRDGTVSMVELSLFNMDILEYLRDFNSCVKKVMSKVYKNISWCEENDMYCEGYRSDMWIEEYDEKLLPCKEFISSIDGNGISIKYPEKYSELSVCILRLFEDIMRLGIINKTYVTMYCMNGILVKTEARVVLCEGVGKEV